MNAESHRSSSSHNPPDADLAARLAELDDQQRQRNAKPFNGTILGLIMLAAIGLPAAFFGVIKLGTMMMPRPMSVADAPRNIDWIFEVKAGSQLAVANNKPMMIAFYTDWCPSCKWMDANIYTNPYITTEAKDIVAVKINAEGQPAIANQYNITKYPTIVWTDSVGNERFRQVGSSSPAEFFGTMRQYK